MNQMFRSIVTRPASAIIVTVCLMLAALAGASAQESALLTINNNTSCAVVVCAANGSACTLIPAGATVEIKIPCTTAAIGIRSCGGLRVIPLGQCLNNIAVGNGCCANVCFVPGIVSCTFFLTINRTAGPCPCPLE